MRGGARYDEEGNLLTGRPKGTARGKKERISITVSQEHKNWLEYKDISYAKTIAKLIDVAIIAEAHK